ncbi:MAG: hypothetical protein RG741_03460 [Bacteroidales bacterium]|nr:hypothetical protein [Bacteroidales bacterium]
MLSINFRFALLFVILVLLQVTLFNRVMLGGYINPQVYVFFILLLPLTIAGWALLLLSFFLGFVIDIFLDSMAIHTAASVFMAFCRPLVVKITIGQPQAEESKSPSYGDFGFFSLLLYSLILIFLHHICLFFLEVFHFSEFSATLLRSVYSTAISLLFVLIAFALSENLIASKR